MWGKSITDPLMARWHLAISGAMCKSNEKAGCHVQPRSGQIRTAEFDRTRAPPSHTVTHNQRLSLISLCNDRASNAYIGRESPHRLHEHVKNAVSHSWLTVIIANPVSLDQSPQDDTSRPASPHLPPRFTERALLLREVDCV